MSSLNGIDQTPELVKACFPDVSLKAGPPTSANPWPQNNFFTNSSGVNATCVANA